VTDVVLKLEGVVILFRCISKRDEFFDYKVTIDGRNNLSIHNETVCRLYKEDVHRLLSYFEEHIKSVASDAYLETTTFVPNDLCFQLQALDGVIETRLDGYVSVNFMLNCKPHGYWGVESVLDLLDLNDFMAKLKLMF